MTFELVTVLLLLASAIVMFALDRPRMDAVALIMMCSLPLTGTITMSESLSGFSDPNIVLIAALFVLGDGLVRTGVARRLGDWLVIYAGNSVVRLTSSLMVSVSTLGATMSSTAITAIFIPVVLRICRTTGISPGRLMMPLSMAGLISGMMTLVATAPNLIVHGELIRRGESGFSFFAFTPFAIPILFSAVIYMLLVQKWLPDSGETDATQQRRRPTLADWVEKYKLAGREHRLRILHTSPLVGKTIDQTQLREDFGANLVAIHRGRSLLQPMAKLELHAGDILFIDWYVQNGDDKKLAEKFGLEELPLTGAHFTDRTQDIGMVELMVPADSDLVGKTIVESEFRTRFGISVIGLRRGVESIESTLRNEDLRTGDTLLAIGPWKTIRSFQKSGSNTLIPLNLPAEMEDVSLVEGRMIHALVILALVVAFMVSGIIPNVQAVLFGCLLMGAVGCVNFTSGYRSIDWKTIVLIVGMLPFSIALQRTGGVELASSGLMYLTSGWGAHGVLAAIFVTTSILSLFISNTATAVLMAPVAISIAENLDASPYPFAMIVALAASAAFMTPVSSPVNTLVMTPGGYRFSDFVKVGVPFTILVLIICVMMVPILLPLY